MTFKPFNGISTSPLGYSPAGDSQLSTGLAQQLDNAKLNFPSGVTSGGNSLALGDILKDIQGGKFGSPGGWGKLISGFSGAFDAINNMEYLKEKKKTNKFRAAGYNQQHGDNVQVFNGESKAQEAARNTALGTEGTAVAATILDATPIKYG